MPSKRYFNVLLPLSHINGKMEQIKTKCHNTSDLEKLEVSGFWYGYRRKDSPNISRYGIRRFCRNLNTNPYTTAEEENRTLFRVSLVQVYAHQKFAADWALMLADFHEQKNYKTPIGYAVAAVRANGGQWLHEWIGERHLDAINK